MIVGQNASHTPAGAAITELILDIFRTNGRLLRTGDKMVRALKLTSARWQVISSIEGQPRTVAQIAREYELSRQGVLWVVQAMKKEGFVELVHNPDHRRSKLVRLTESGREIARLVKDLQCEWANGMGETFNVEELRGAIDLLRRLADIVKAQESDGSEVD